MKYVRVRPDCPPPSLPSLPPLAKCFLYFSFRNQDDDGVGEGEKGGGNTGGQEGGRETRVGLEEVITHVESREAAAAAEEEAEGGGDGRRITTARELMETLVSELPLPPLVFPNPPFHTTGNITIYTQITITLERAKIVAPV